MSPPPEGYVLILTGPDGRFLHEWDVAKEFGDLHYILPRSLMVSEIRKEIEAAEKRRNDEG